MKKVFNPHRIFLVHQHGRCFIVLYTNMAAVTSCENDLLAKKLRGHLLSWCFRCFIWWQHLCPHFPFPCLSPRGAVNTYAWALLSAATRPRSRDSLFSYIQTGNGFNDTGFKIHLIVRDTRQKGCAYQRIEWNIKTVQKGKLTNNEFNERTTRKSKKGAWMNGENCIEFKRSEWALFKAPAVQKWLVYCHLL